MEQGTNLIIGLIILALWVASFFIPFYGFIQKRWKGLGFGCLDFELWKNLLHQEPNALLSR